ncbi:MAG TPA: hypothetical protein DEB05_11715 [Firmicutes bacterium]|nr:hypothetical protein [Bacillota bacterium]
MLEQKLQGIAKSISNPQSMPADAHMIREDFLKFYPKEKWQSMTWNTVPELKKFRLQYTYPAPFKARNVYFDLDGIGRV